jgi:hypothetical protein
MKKLLTISTLVITVMFSSTSFAEWTRVTGNLKGDTHYVDFERIRKHDGYVYFWTLSDYLIPKRYTGHLSSKTYRQGDCNLFREKSLSISGYKEPMGKGTGETYTYPDADWGYPPPDSIIEEILKLVCSH